MKVRSALEGVGRLYVETAPLIYYVEEHPVNVFKMDAVIETAALSSIELVSSVITLTEVLVQPIRLGNTALEREYRDILTGSDRFSLCDVTPRTAELAARLRARYDLRTPDALHLAAAVETGCDAFLTNDRSLKRVSEIRVLALDELEPDQPPASR